MIEYKLATITAGEAAERAITVLAEVEEIGGDSLFYCLQPANVLVLAGLSALSPHVEFDSGFSEAELQKLNSVLSQYDCKVLKQDEYGSDPDSCGYAFMNVDALQDTKNRYPIAADAPLQPPTDPTWASYLQWTSRMWIHYANLLGSGELPNEWNQSWFVPHGIHFGMMLGLPGIALANTADRTIGALDSDSEMDRVVVQAEGSSFYRKSDVSYRIAKQEMNNPQILDHAQLWQETLNKVYAKYTDEKLASIPGFSDEASKFAWTS